MTTIRGLDHIEQAVAAFNQHDPRAFGLLHAPEVVVRDPFYSEPLQGREAVEKDIADLFRAFPDIRASLVRSMEDGDWVAGEVSVAGTHTGPLAGPNGDIAPTGRKVTFGVGHFTRLDAAGLAIDDRRYYDVAGLLAQIGLT